MRIDPQFAALQSNPALQRKAQAALEAARNGWLDSEAKAIVDDLKLYGSGAGLDACPALGELYRNADAAIALVEALVGPMIEALSCHPHGHVPLRHQRSVGLTILQLAQKGRATLSLLAYDAMEQSPTSACFSGGDRHEIVLAGAADMRLLNLMEVREGRAAIDCERRRLVAGESISTEGFSQTRVVERVHGRMVLLRLARSDEQPCDSLQYALGDGRLIHRASGSRDESRSEMAMALLGRMGRSDAAPLLAELANEGSRHIRWQALRECLALDSLEGFRALSGIAADAEDELASPAGALRAQLLETYPELSHLETAPCPA
ncbi:hypothetical protein [Qipengyuania vesicularis]|uniref:hypothetical protein n=1 Tax=Qipengyuania vesicularis TaxID=2867232 RepID=UPI001C86EB80|nr:hypothetical protein [Qipengyuania vesicularis]MBX7526290.1 hypothetical protein [Qipengyuania vesicularis]